MKIKILVLTVFVLALLPYSIVMGQESSDDLDARREALRRCRALLKSTIDKIDAGNYEGALADIDSVILCDPKNADAYFHRGRILVRKNDTTSAVSALEKGVEMAPLSTRNRLLLARLKLSLDAPDDALEQIEKVLAFKPRESEALYLKGMVYLAKSDSTAAIEILEKALDKEFEKK
jgi:tetratricopeptide (TPR) repeat protein